MKNFLIGLIVMNGVFFSLLSGAVQALPEIEALPELPLTLVRDFTDVEDIASPTLPVITGEGTLFFYDYKLKQLYRTHLDSRKFEPIGRFGEGPEEYDLISDIYLAKGLIYLLDSKGKILCYDMKGTFRWEDRPGKIFNKIPGQQRCVLPTAMPLPRIWAGGLPMPGERKILERKPKSHEPA
jgi:hypothetical protein